MPNFRKPSWAAASLGGCTVAVIVCVMAASRQPPRPAVELARSAMVFPADR
jgi:hypothetical protein